jgi:hypothetical protein
MGCLIGRWLGGLGSIVRNKLPRHIQTATTPSPATRLKSRSLAVITDCPANSAFINKIKALLSISISAPGVISIPLAAHTRKGIERVRA